MGKKKRDGTLNIVEYTPSKYQEAIFDFVENGVGNLVVEAVAGSAKTWTMVKSLDFIPGSKKILFSAFNKDIVKELDKKINGMENVDIRTLHSLGLTMLKRNFPEKKFVPEPFKYDAYIKQNLRYISSANLNNFDQKDYLRYSSNIKKYVEFGRFYLCQTPRDLDMIEERYGIDTIADEKEVAIEVMEWGKSELDNVDYTDMVWMPNSLYCKPLGLLYDFIMIDECQDMNKAERELVLKCFKMGTRMMCVGDRSQCVYSYAGSDPDSFSELLKLPNTTKLPLSISYRCSKNIVDFAKRLVPEIEGNDDGREGVILENVSLSDVKDGDMIICRNNAPLLKVYNDFLKLGKRAYIRGKELGSNMKLAVKSTKQELLNADCTKDGVFARLYYDLFVTRNKIATNSGIDAKMAMESPIVENKLDMIKALEILAEGITTSEELIAKIDEIFPKRSKKDGISLSTIHKSKGLEADNVYIACKSLMPSKAAKKDWEIRQEHNLMYVAYTRARNVLGFIDEEDFKSFDNTSTKAVDRLERIENLVGRVFGKKTSLVVTSQTASDIIRNATVIRQPVPKTRTIAINSGNKINSFSDLTRRRKPKIKR
jgi:superfamily I DNA/RNA helicase